MPDDIIIEGVETNNLKNVDVAIKKNTINLIIGPSGSGKSSLAYDTIAQIGQHEFLSMFADDVTEPSYKVKAFYNMVAAIPIKQSNFNNNLRSTIGTYFGLNRSIGLVYAALLGLSEDFFVLNKESNLCENCHGLGFVSVLDENRIIDYNIPIAKNPFRCWNRYKDFYIKIIDEYCYDMDIDSEKTFRQLTEKEKYLLLYSESEKKYSVKYKKTGSYSRRTSKFYGVMTGNPMMTNFVPGKQFFANRECQHCHGHKYSNKNEQFRVFGMSIGEFMITPFNDLLPVISQIVSEVHDSRLTFALKNINNFVNKAVELNIGYLFFHRSIPTLSGGELQRLRMVQVFNTQLTDLLIVLDEPLAGLSGNERQSIYHNVLSLSKKHTMVIVDHSDIFVNDAKNVIALGEKGGCEGGFIIDEKRYLKDQRVDRNLLVPLCKNEINIKIDSLIYGYKGAEICIADKCMNLMTGYSGVGKSTLLREYFPQYFEKYSYINQKPLLGNKNSSVATALDIFGRISNIFAEKFNKDKRFFSNLTGNDGMCPVCEGAGYLEYGSDRQAIVRLECQECEGTGFNKNLKKYQIDNKSLFDIWRMTIDEAIHYFEPLDKKIVYVLNDASSIMLGHLQIGQPTGSLSGGENIRVKILKSTKVKAKVLGIDEPFKGLSNSEIYNVAKFLDRLRSTGVTIIVVDHTEGVSCYFSKKILLENIEGKLIGRET